MASSPISFTQENLDALVQAIAEGVMSVKYQDREIRYRSLDDMLRLKDLMMRQLGCKQDTVRIKAKFCKGV